MDSRLQGFVPFGRFLPRLGPLLGAAFFYAGSGSHIHHRCSGGQRTCFHREADLRHRLQIGHFTQVPI